MRAHALTNQTRLPTQISPEILELAHLHICTFTHLHPPRRTHLHIYTSPYRPLQIFHQIFYVFNTNAQADE